MNPPEPHKNARGYKTRIIKQRESHIVFAIDTIDSCIKLTESDTPDAQKIKEQLQKIRKEICKL